MRTLLLSLILTACAIAQNRPSLPSYQITPEMEAATQKHRVLQDLRDDLVASRAVALYFMRIHDVPLEVQAAIKAWAESDLSIKPKDKKILPEFERLIKTDEVRLWSGSYVEWHKAFKKR